MSIAIQKKRFNDKTLLEYSQKLLKFEKNDPLQEQYMQTLNDFELNFKKSSSQTTLKSLKGVLEGFYKSLKSDEFFLTDLSKHGDVTSNNNQSIFLMNRTSDIVHMLADYIIDRRSILVCNRRSFDLLDSISSETREVTLLCVKILKLFSIINIHFAVLLSNKPKFCAKMFELMLQDNKAYFKQVLGIQEALIAANPEVIKPSIYPFMQEVLVHMPKKYFARFSRIIALFVLENSDKIDFKELPFEYSDNKMVKVHSFLFSIPNLLETYTVILEYLREIMERLMTATPQNLRKIVRYLKESNIITDSGLNLSFLKPLFEQSEISDALAGEIFTPKFIVKFIVKKSNLTEILFILSNLLLSKRKVEVQTRLRQINFLERAINPLFDLLFHPDLDAGNQEDLFQVDDFQASNPLATTRIQLLRVIINFCDRDSSNTTNKELLLSQEERTILYSQIIHGGLTTYHPTYNNDPELLSKDPKKIAEFINQITVVDKNPTQPFLTQNNLKNNAFESVQKKGLMNKIISLFGRFHPNSNYRFWLASCVESFLRGFYEPHQIFVAHSGLLYTLLDQILNKKITKSSNVQITYDLVGEIIKFNKYNTLFLENLCESFGWTDSLAEQALLNIIDSNVFLRALLLSFQRFDHAFKKRIADSEENIFNFTEHSKIYQIFSKGSIRWFYLIIESIEPTHVNQDNICCINTTLIMSIFADQKGDLERYIQTLVDEGGNRAKELLLNFSEILEIWHRYYISKSKDGFSLEYTSSIPFHYFQIMKSKLQYLIAKKVKKL